MKNTITFAQIIALSILVVYGAQASTKSPPACPSLSASEHCAITP
ncbi:hypothetical protein [Primorskyibacter flagellatus]|uniref:Uncharacterized protein n=1 Tax=Primorskyibacter flagellatus TaxID=1387277 RepID=A0A1W1Z1K1_9RHOB|nr:hypothetical protein [Primorskyibacter flagellatus]SMC42263.1 hypothetical protein SAMN06295998_101144 [Primorskyibacter flagellatus]